MIKKLKNYSVNLLVLTFLNGCASVPDVPLCTELSFSRGWCTNTISDEEFEVNDFKPHDFGDGELRTWWSMKPFMILIPYPSWVKLKEYIIERCKQDGGCNDGVGNWEQKIQDLDQKVQQE